MIVNDLFENVAGPEKCWPGHRKVGTKPGTGKNAGKRVNDCEKIKESTGDFNIGDPVIITGNVEYRGKTGDVREIGRDGAFVVVDLYNYGPHSFHSSDVSYNDYADSDEEDNLEEQSVAESAKFGMGRFRDVASSTERAAQAPTRVPLRTAAELASLIDVDHMTLMGLIHRFPGFPKPVPGIRARHGARAYYRPQEFKQWVRDNSILDVVKQKVSENNDEKVGNMPADRFDDAMARLKKLAGAGPLKTVWDPQKRVYKNMPTAVQPKK